MKLTLCTAAGALIAVSAQSQFEAFWEQAYDHPTVHGQDRAHAITVDRMGNTYVAGQSGQGTSGIDYVVVKYSPIGVELWATPIDGVSRQDACDRISQHEQRRLLVDPLHTAQP